MTSHFFARLGLGVLVLYLAYVCVFFLLQRKIAFPRHLVQAPPGTAVRPPEVEVLWLDTPAGKVEAWFLPPDASRSAAPAPAVIFAHGNAELIDFWPGALEGFARLGIGVLLVEYPGYGRSEGAPSQKAIAAAFAAAYDVLASRHDVDADRIVLFGRSLGGGAVCALAAQRPSAALILMSAFTSIRSMAHGFLLPGFIVRDPFDNLSVVRSYAGPVLVIHGRTDTIIPYGHGVNLSRAAENSIMISYDCGHNNCPPDWSAFWEAVASFLCSAGIITTR